MIRNALAMLGAGLAGLLGLRALGARRGVTLSLAAVLVILALLIVIAALYWQHAVVALVVTALCALGVAVMFQRIKPGQAFRGAAAALVLMFFFTWLAVQLGHVFFGDGITDWVGEYDLYTWSATFQLPTLDIPSSAQDFLLAMGVALLCAALVSANWLRPWLVFIGLSLLLLMMPSFLERHGILLGIRDFVHDPFYLLLAFLAVLAVFVRLIEQPHRKRNSWRR